MFLQGYITESLEPIVKDVALIGKEGPIVLEAILKTGFNGMCCLPRRFKDLCELSSLGVETFELADGTLVEEELYVGKLTIGDDDYPVELVLTGMDRALIGMELLLGRVATFDLKKMHIEVK